MNSKVDAPESRMDSAKLGFSIALLLGAVVAFHYFEDQSLLFRVLGLVSVATVALLIASRTAVGARTIGFAQDARTEVRKVVWPTRQETVQTTLIVFVMVIIMGIVLWLFDMFLLWVVRLLTGQGG
jgi:preprotein translocase subunit SecE